MTSCSQITVSPLRSPHPRALLATASIAVALAAADTYVVVLALTDMMAGVGLGVDALQKATPIISGFLLGYVAVLPLIGRLADLVDRQKVLLGCLAVFVVGSSITALAVELPVLVAGRIIQGVGGGGLVPATLAIVAALWPAERRGLPLGVVGAVQELGSVLGPLLGAFVLAVATWRMIFWLNAAAGLVLAIAVTASGGVQLRRPRPAVLLLTLLAVASCGLALAAPDALVTSVVLGVPFVPFGDATSALATPIGALAAILAAAALAVGARALLPVLRRVDLVGALLVGGALGSVILTFAAADPAREVVGPLGFALLPLAGILLILYAVHHRRAATPLIPRGLVHGRVLWALLVSACTGVALVAIVVDIPLLARLVHTSSQTEAALVLVRFLVAVPVGALLGGWSLRWIGDGVATSLGLFLNAIALALMTGWGQGAFTTAVSTVVLALAGAGLGLALAPVNNAALAAAPPAEHGAVSSLVVVARMVGMVVGLALLTAAGLHQYYREVAALPSRTDPSALIGAAVVQVHWVFRGAAIASVLGALAALTLGVRPRRENGAMNGTRLEPPVRMT